MSVKRRLLAPPRPQEPEESWQGYARTLSAAGWSLRQIAYYLGRHHTTVLNAVDPEFNARKTAACRRRNDARTLAERRRDSLDRQIAKAVAAGTKPPTSIRHRLAKKPAPYVSPLAAFRRACRAAGLRDPSIQARVWIAATPSEREAWLRL